MPRRMPKDSSDILEMLTQETIREVTREFGKPPSRMKLGPDSYKIKIPTVWSAENVWARIMLSWQPNPKRWDKLGDFTIKWWIGILGEGEPEMIDRAHLIIDVSDVRSVVRELRTELDRVLG